MNNKELKELYKNNEKSLEEIEKILLSRPHKKVRGRTANIDLLLTFIPKQTEDDIDLFITISGIYAVDELPGNISIPEDFIKECKESCLVEG